MKSKAIVVEDGESVRHRVPVIMACDPGKSGGFCWNDRYGTVHTCAMPETLNQTVNLIRRARPDFFLIERVRSSPQMGVVSAFTFGQGIGQLAGIVATLNIFWRDVTPQVWMRQAELGKVKDHANVRLWKKHLLKHAQKKSPRVFHGLNLTNRLKIADAVLLWHFAVHVHAEYKF